MRARDHEHRHRPLDRFARIADHTPDDEGQDAGRDRNVEQDRGRSVGEGLGSRSRGLRLPHEALDARERRVVAHGLDPDPEGAVGRHRAGDDPVPRPVRDRLRSPGDHRFVERGGSLHDRSVRGDAPARPDEHEVARLQLGDRNRTGHRTVDHLGVVRQKRGQRIERAGGLPERFHLLPVAQEHHVDQQSELPPELEIEGAELGGDTRDEGDQDRQRDEQHHPRLPVANLADAATEERQAAVDEDDRSEDRGDPVGEWEGRGGEAQPLLQHLRPHEHGDRQQDTQPEPVAEHRDAVSGVLIVPLVPTGAVAPVCVVSRRRHRTVIRVAQLDDWLLGDFGGITVGPGGAAVVISMVIVAHLARP